MTWTIEATRWFLAAFFVFVALFYTVRIVLIRRRSGRSPVEAGRPGTLHFATHMTFRVFRALILAVCVARLAFPGMDPYLVPFPALWQVPLLLAGDFLLAVSFAAVLGIHFYMGSTWRSGTRPDGTTRLITTGPFARSRHPMMLWVLVAQVGLFLALPTLFTLICLVAGTWAVLAQVEVEERMLRRRFGAEYEAYLARTTRWPRLRRDS